VNPERTLTDNDNDMPPPPKRRLKRGGGRMKEIAVETTVEREALEAQLISELGRPATAIDRIAIESIAAAAIRARRLRAAGKDDLEQQRLIAQLLRATGLKPDKPVPQKAEEDFSAEMRRLAMPKVGEDDAAS
jgi:hypothetical protein